MPIYEFKCKKCGHQFEFIKIKSNDVATCPGCKAQSEKNLEQLISTGVDFNLKGDGWYRDGYSRDPSKK